MVAMKDSVEGFSTVVAVFDSKERYQICRSHVVDINRWTTTTTTKKDLVMLTTTLLSHRTELWELLRSSPSTEQFVRIIFIIHRFMVNVGANGSIFYRSGFQTFFPSRLRSLYAGYTSMSTKFFYLFIFIQNISRWNKSIDKINSV